MTLKEDLASLAWSGEVTIKAVHSGTAWYVSHKTGVEHISVKGEDLEEQVARLRYFVEVDGRME